MNLFTVSFFSAAGFDYQKPVVKVVFYSINVSYMFCFIVCMIFICKHLRQSGLNHQYRKLIIRRYVLYVSLMFVCHLTAIFDYMNITGVIHLSYQVQWILAFYFVVVPIIYAAIRISDPAVYNTTKRNFRMKCGRRTNDENSDSNSSKSEDDDELKDSLNAFLTSSLNVELVYTILKGIISAANQEDLETWKNG